IVGILVDLVGKRVDERVPLRLCRLFFDRLLTSRRLLFPYGRFLFTYGWFLLRQRGPGPRRRGSGVEPRELVARQVGVGSALVLVEEVFPAPPGPQPVGKIEVALHVRIGLTRIGKRLDLGERGLIARPGSSAPSSAFAEVEILHQGGRDPRHLLALGGAR